MKNQIMITDGIVNEKAFKEEKVRLLWILKEANDTTSKEGWDMCEFLRERNVENEGLFHYRYWRATFGLICKFSYGILDPDKSYEEINNYDDIELTKVLDRIAYINIKKTPGGSMVNYFDFNRYIADGKYIECLQNQIKDINPTIVYCGGTFEYVFPKLKGFDLNKDWLHIENNIKYINGWHPNAKINHNKYFVDIRKTLGLNSSH